MTTQQLIEEVRSLPELERTKLLNVLHDDMHQVEPELLDAWAVEAEGRLAAVDNGTMPVYSGEEVLQEARRRLGK